MSIKNRIAFYNPKYEKKSYHSPTLVQQNNDAKSSAGRTLTTAPGVQAIATFADDWTVSFIDDKEKLTEDKKTRKLDRRMIMLGSQTKQTINLSMAAYIHKDHEESVEIALQEKARGTLTEKALGDIELEHIQLVPQARNRLTKEGFEKVAQMLPDTQFRLHANTRVLKEHRFVDLSGFQDNKEYFQALADFSNWMKAPAYSLHSGKKKECKKTKLIDNLKAVQEMFDCPVAIEPQYPCASGLLIDTWWDHEWLLRQEVPFALDLSHLNIVAHKSGHLPVDLVEEMLASKNCIEVHVSSNSGATDAHQQCNERQWWSDLLPKTNPKAIIFSEGSRYMPFKKETKEN